MERFILNTNHVLLELAKQSVFLKDFHCDYHD